MWNRVWGNKVFPYLGHVLFQEMQDGCHLRKLCSIFNHRQDNKAIIGSLLWFFTGQETQLNQYRIDGINGKQDGGQPCQIRYAREDIITDQIAHCVEKVSMKFNANYCLVMWKQSYPMSALRDIKKSKIATTYSKITISLAVVKMEKQSSFSCHAFISRNSAKYIPNRLDKRSTGRRPKCLYYKSIWRTRLTFTIGSEG